MPMKSQCHMENMLFPSFVNQILLRIFVSGIGPSGNIKYTLQLQLVNPILSNFKQLQQVKCTMIIYISRAIIFIISIILSLLLCYYYNSCYYKYYYNLFCILFIINIVIYILFLVLL